MITVLIALFFGWLFGLIGVDTLFHNMIGLSQQGYYIGWAVMGAVLWLKGVIKR